MTLERIAKTGGMWGGTRKSAITLAHKNNLRTPHKARENQNLNLVVAKMPRENDPYNPPKELVVRWHVCTLKFRERFSDAV